MIERLSVFFTKRKQSERMTSSTRKGCFITFEGIDGCGKSTQAAAIYRLLSAEGYQVRLFREPGSTKIAERIRKILLDKKLTIPDMTELLMYEAARAELTVTEIAPLLAKGHIVLCDRFYDSTTAYQGYGRKLDIRMVRSLNRMTVGNTVPDLTLLFDVDLKTGMERRGDSADRLESQSKAFFGRVRKGFLEIARKERRRVKVIDAVRSIEEIFEDTTAIVKKKLKSHDVSRVV